jgi:hypothetical protein
MGGFGSGIVFILVPIYMKELRGEQHNSRIVDLLITLFGFGIFIQYFIGEVHLFLIIYYGCEFITFKMISMKVDNVKSIACFQFQNKMVHL